MASCDHDEFSKLFNLSKYSRDDAPEIVKSLSNPLIAGQLRSLPNPYDLSHALAWLDSLEEEQKVPEKAPLRWAIRETSSGKLIGDISLRPMEEEGTYQLGYWLAQDYWGKGLMTKAINAVFEITKEKSKMVRNVIVCIKPDNYGSRRVAEKNGFHLVGQQEEVIGEETYCFWDWRREL